MAHIPTKSMNYVCNLHTHQILLFLFVALLPNQVCSLRVAKRMPLSPEILCREMPSMERRRFKSKYVICSLFE